MDFDPTKWTLTLTTWSWERRGRVSMFRVCRNYGSVLRVPTVPAPSPRHWKRLCASRQLHSWLRRRLSGCGVERENDALVATGVVCGRATRCAGRRAGVRPVSSAAAVSTTGTDEFTVSSNVGGRYMSCIHVHIRVCTCTLRMLYCQWPPTLFSLASQTLSQEECG